MSASVFPGHVRLPVSKSQDEIGPVALSALRTCDYSIPSKGPATPETTERTYPYIVEMLVPEGGFGRKLDAMHQFTPATEYKPSAGAAAAKEDATTFDGASPIPE